MTQEQKDALRLIQNDHPSIDFVPILTNAEIEKEERELNKLLVAAFPIKVEL